MAKYPFNKKEKERPVGLQTGYCCNNCGCKTFIIQSGGSSCCAYIKFICTKCNEIDDWDIGTGDC